MREIEQLKGSDFDSQSTGLSWRKTILPVTATLQDAIRSLNETAMQVALVLSSDNILLGTITDGDIRRGLLRGLDMTSSVEAIMHREPLVVPIDLSRDVVLQLMHANKIHQLPIVDVDRRVVGLHLLDELSTPIKRLNMMVIMAGGQGLRLRPHTEQCPKPMLPVAGKPMLEHIIERGKSEGFSQFVIATHYLGHMIEEYFGDGHLWEVEIDYLREDEPLGTAGAISLIKPIPNLPFVVTNGDVLTDIHYGELLDFHSRHQACATMAVRLHEWQNPFGVVLTKGVELVGFEEKPISRTHINSGVYVLESSVVEHLNHDEYCDMPTLFCRLKEYGKRTIVYPMHEPWLDVGREEDLTRAHFSMA